MPQDSSTTAIAQSNTVSAIGIYAPVRPQPEQRKQADQQGEERHAFDQGGRDDHRHEDAAAGFGLASDGVGRPAADQADADAGADDDDARTRSWRRTGPRVLHAPWPPSAAARRELIM